MWMEEKGTERVNKKRTLQLLETGATTIATACPFCMTMLTDGLKDQNKEEEIKNLDVAELLDMACATEAPTEEKAPMKEEVAAAS
jgi:Fe-S oxidoreductase